MSNAQKVVQSVLFPDGTCDLGFFEVDVIINVVFCLSLFCLVVLCVCFFGKDKSDQGSATQEGEQLKLSQNSPKKNKGNSNALKQMVGISPAGPYNQLSDEAENQAKAIKDAADIERQRKKMKKEVQPRRLRTSVPIKPFVVDDGNDEEAVSHNSTSKLFTRDNSSIDMSLRSDISPYTKRLGLDITKLVSQSVSSELLQNGDVNVNFMNPINGIGIARKKSSFMGEPLSANTKGASMVLNITNRESEITRRIDDYFEEKKEEEQKNNQEGYELDGNIESIVTDDRFEDKEALSCELCNLNKKDCRNLPCRHVVACYACMELFKEKYGVCPRCELILTAIEKTAKRPPTIQTSKPSK